MKKILPGVFAIALALGFTAFTNGHKNKPFLLYFKNTGPDKAHAHWVQIPNPPGPSDCENNSANYCYGTAPSGSLPTITFEGNYVGNQ